VELARRHGTRLHVLHLTTARELALFEAGDRADKRITAEACVHHLFFDETDYEEKGSLIKCNPAIKTAVGRVALRQALADGLLDVIGTDHAPHTLEEKGGNYFKAPAGLPLAQHALAMALELYHDGVLILPQVVDKCAHSPARLFGVRERGYLREGYRADLVLVDLDARHTVTRGEILYKCGWSPLEGRTLRSRVNATFVNGVSVFRGNAVEGSAAGMRLEFER
jgi:dihydroorotase